MSTRRDFLTRSTLAALGLSLPSGAAAELSDRTPEGSPRTSAPDIHRQPDAVTVQTAGDYVPLRATSAGRWEGAGVTVAVEEASSALRVTLAAPAVAVQRIHLRWRGRLTGTPRILGDAWERGYGDLEWRGIVPDRVLPWYAASTVGSRTDAYGVMTGAAAFCFFQLDAEGVSLWADVRSGGVGVELGGRTLTVCAVVSQVGEPGESPFDALHDFCRTMCARPRLLAQPVYGTNDWYWAYGNNTAESVQRDAHNVVDLSPSGGNRPFAVIDDGWQPERGTPKGPTGIWDRGNEKFPDMPGLAARVKKIGAVPGIWIRPLLSPDDAPESWRLPRERRMLDPTVPAVLEKVTADMRRITQWGFALIKHDYSTWDILGRWGFQMGSALTNEGWTFAEGPKRTTAEVIGALYDTIRAASGNALVIGCNTVSHLSAGRFELCRVGDDTSGKDWDRVRRMGINSLAFRGVQQGAFYAADPDCVGVTSDIPWELNRRWLDLVARSGTVLFASLAPDALGTTQKADLRAAYARAAQSQPVAEPLDWQETTWPSQWKQDGNEQTYDWMGTEGMERAG